MHRSYTLYLDDILTSIDKIQSYVGAYSLNEFINDQKTYDAVIRNLEIIGEAAKQLPQNVKDRHPSIEWRKVYLFRNILAHEYFGISNELLWDIIQNRLPELKTGIQKVIEKDG